jgi:fluoroacetyl-CoA thioesterase
MTTMTQPLAPGLRHVQRLTVTDDLTVPAVSAAFVGFADMPKVFATAYMVGFIEWACIEALKPCLLPGQRTVGTRIDVTHEAATPPGMEVTAEVELIAVEGRRVSFKVTCRDARDVIGQGTHERAIIDLAAFEARLARKAG